LQGNSLYRFHGRNHWLPNFIAIHFKYLFSICTSFSVFKPIEEGFFYRKVSNYKNSKLVRANFRIIF